MKLMFDARKWNPNQQEIEQHLTQLHALEVARIRNIKNRKKQLYSLCGAIMANYAISTLKTTQKSDLPKSTNDIFSDNFLSEIKTSLLPLTLSLPSPLQQSTSKNAETTLPEITTSFPSLILRTPQGKPYTLDGVLFNISHSNGLIVVIATKMKPKAKAEAEAEAEAEAIHDQEKQTAKNHQVSYTDDSKHKNKLIDKEAIINEEALINKEGPIDQIALDLGDEMIGIDIEKISLFKDCKSIEEMINSMPPGVFSSKEIKMITEGNSLFIQEGHTMDNRSTEQLIEKAIEYKTRIPLETFQSENIKDTLIFTSKITIDKKIKCSVLQKDSESLKTDSDIQIVKKSLIKKKKEKEKDKEKEKVKEKEYKVKNSINKNKNKWEKYTTSRFYHCDNPLAARAISIEKWKLITFYEKWTYKEAYIKALGLGLICNLDMIQLFDKKHCKLLNSYFRDSLRRASQIEKVSVITEISLFKDFIVTSTFITQRSLPFDLIEEKKEKEKKDFAEWMFIDDLTDIYTH